MKVHPLRPGPWLLLTLGLGVLIFFWQLGATGLVDETPPLFAAAARARGTVTANSERKIIESRSHVLRMLHLLNHVQ